MKYLKKFETESGFQSTKSTLEKPYVCYTVDEEIVHYGQKEFEAEILMISASGYKLLFEGGEYYIFDYKGTKKYEDSTYHEYSFMDMMSILAPTRNVTKVEFPFEGYYMEMEGDIMPMVGLTVHSIYGYKTQPTSDICIEHHDTSNLNRNNYETVDLGLTSGTLWATCNVGANSPTEYGKYFAWGDTVGYYDNEEYSFDWSAYKYGDGINFTKYNTEVDGYSGTVDNKMTLDPEDDAVHIEMGGDWRMPTKAQMEELITETNHEWIEDYQGSGINGRLFTSKNDPSKSIFIPASGGRWDTSVISQGDGVCLRSSSLMTNEPRYSWVLVSNSGDYFMGNYGRYSGFCLRGVL